MIQHWNVSYLPALAFTWQAPFTARTDSLHMLAVIDPNTQDDVREFEPLVGSHKELAVLHKFFEVEVQEGTSATKTAFKERASDHSFIHIAAHSKADNERGLGAYIRFAGFSNSDCRLRACEIGALHLQCVLCNLSSCQSGSLCITDWSEVEGLATSFLVAGTRHVLAALWNVSDMFAPELMGSFYSGQFAHKPSLSLSEAQRSWASGTGPFAHPKFWAPFYVVERFDANPSPTDENRLYRVQ